MASLLEVLMGLAPKPTKKQSQELSGPLPELLTLEDEASAPWEVVRTKRMSGVDLENRVMHVPFETSAFALKQRVHELGHAALTPSVDLDQVATEAGVPSLMVESLEDARVHSILTEDESIARMIDAAAFGEEQEQQIATLERGLPMWTQRLDDDEKLALGASLYFATAETANEPVGRRLAEACGVPIEPLEHAVDAIRKQPFETIKKALSHCWEELHPPQPPSPAPSEDPGDAAPSGSGDTKSDKGESGSESWSDFGKPVDPKSPPPPPKPPEPKPYTPPPPPAMEMTKEWRDASVFSPIIAPTKEALEQDRADGDGDGDEGEPTDAARAIEYMDRNFNTQVMGEDSGKKLSLDDYRDLDSHWGTMDYEELPLTVALKRPRKHPSRKAVSRDDGGNLGSVHRLRLDGKVFKRKMPLRTRKRIGTLLLDGSGSMRISADQIERMLEMAPQATIAMYSGYQGVKDGVEYTGKLWVLAKKRKRCDSRLVNDEYTGGWQLEGKTPGNVVDGPALEWLTHQPGPRIWVSDGGVTGNGDTASSQLITDVVKLMRVGKIIQVPDIDCLFADADDLPEKFIDYAHLSASS